MKRSRCTQVQLIGLMTVASVTLVSAPWRFWNGTWPSGR